MGVVREQMGVSSRVQQKSSEHYAYSIKKVLGEITGGKFYICKMLIVLGNGFRHSTSLVAQWGRDSIVLVFIIQRIPANAPGAKFSQSRNL